MLLGYTGTPETDLIYTGEYFDINLIQYNLHAQYYDPAAHVPMLGVGLSELALLKSRKGKPIFT